MQSAARAAVRRAGPFSTSSSSLAVRWASTAKSAKAKAGRRTSRPLPDGWEAVIGVEVHAQIKARRKLFSKARLPVDRVDAQSPDNTCVTPFDAALPGTLPMLQAEPLRLALRACVALDCTIARRVSFDRKHYHYPDLPSGFQISQRYSPLAKDGRVALLFDDGHLSSPAEEVSVRIEQIQLEQDTAKSTHQTSDTAGPITTINLNRAGAALIEIVSGPDIRTPDQAGAYIRKLRETLRRIAVSDGNMNEGSLRCDVNVSIHRIDEPWGARCEVKNLNSIRFAMTAIEHEMHRQHALLQAGKSVEQETRGYNEADGTTYRLRTKEQSPDYRYMPDANMPPLHIDETMLRDVTRDMPELPDAQRTRLMQQYDVALREVNVLMRLGLEDADYAERRRTKQDAVSYFEQLTRGDGVQGRTAMNWVVQDLLTALNANDLTFADNPITVVQMRELVSLVQRGKLANGTARKLLAELVKTKCEALAPYRSGKSSSSDDDDDDAEAIRALLTARDAFALDSAEALRGVCEEVISAKPDLVEAARAGDEYKMNRLLVEVMRRTNGRANPSVAVEVLKKAVHMSPSPA